ncbi:MAG: SLATT domain-containing protein [Anaerococcus sp.]|nr:SLATT domain-containing protein [Anaerococcus sp.]
MKIISTILSLIITIISTMFKSFNLQQLSDKHKSTANELLVMRDKFRTLLVEINLDIEDNSRLLSNYKALQIELHNIYNEAPSTTEEAVDKARIALEIKEDNKFSNEEIDRNLPENLRYGG